ncbi:hypothetical protein ABFX02_14G267100 [Erythranthe guttata]
MKANASQQNKFLRIITTPFRALGKARDFYVKRIMDCAGSNVIGLQATSQAPGLPRSFSTASSSARSDNDEDYRELVRATSAGRSIGGGVDLEAYLMRREMGMRGGSGGGPATMPPRSLTVSMGRIDEERPCCYFREDFNGRRSIVNSNNELKYPRSKSHAVARTPF